MFQKILIFVSATVLLVATGCTTMDDEFEKFEVETAKDVTSPIRLDEGKTNINLCRNRNYNQWMLTFGKGKKKETVIYGDNIHRCDVVETTEANGIKTSVTPASLQNTKIRRDEAAEDYSYARLEFDLTGLDNSNMNFKEGGLLSALIKIVAKRERDAVMWLTVYPDARFEKESAIENRLIYVFDYDDDDVIVRFQPEGAVGPWRPLSGDSDLFYEVNFAFAKKTKITILEKLIDTASAYAGILDSTGSVLSNITRPVFREQAKKFTDVIDQHFERSQDIFIRTQISFVDDREQRIGTVLVFDSKTAPTGALRIFTRMTNSVLISGQREAPNTNYPPIPNFAADATSILGKSLGDLPLPSVGGTAKTAYHYFTVEQASLLQRLKDADTKQHFRNACREANSILASSLGLQFYDRAAVLWALLNEHSNYFLSDSLTNNACPNKDMNAIWSQLNLDTDVNDGPTVVGKSPAVSQLKLRSLADWYRTMASDIKLQEQALSELEVLLKDSDAERRALIINNQKDVIDRSQLNAIELLEEVAAENKMQKFFVSDERDILKDGIRKTYHLPTPTALYFDIADPLRQQYGSDVCVGTSETEIDAGLLFGSTTSEQTAAMMFGFSSQETTDDPLPIVFALAADEPEITCTDNQSDEAGAEQELAASETTKDDSQFTAWISRIEDPQTRRAIESSPFLLQLVADYQTHLGEPDSFVAAVNGQAACLTACRAYGQPAVSIVGTPSFSDMFRILLNTRYGYVEEASRRWDALEKLDRLVEKASIDAIWLSQKDRDYISGPFVDILETSSQHSGNQYKNLRALIEKASP